MTTIAIAAKNRLTVRGVLDGARYLVKREAAGWWIVPAPKNRSRTRVVKRTKKDLTAHLDALAELGFTFEPAVKESVPPCRF